MPKGLLALVVAGLVLAACLLGVIVLLRRRRARPPIGAVSNWAALTAPADLGRWRIRYVDSQGNRTARVIRVMAVRFDPPAISAWCELQDRERRFLVERIEQAIDMKTGAAIDLAGWMAARREQSKSGASRVARAA